MKLELLQDKTTEEITSIWLEYHLKKNVLAAVITVEQYELLMQRGKQNPLFILPLPRSQGFEFMLLQYAANCIHFTPLLCYQVIFFLNYFILKLKLIFVNQRSTKKTLQNV